MKKKRIRFSGMFLCWVLIKCAVVSQVCFPQGLQIGSQSELDQFSLSNPNCRIIEGDVSISGGDIVNLEPLGDLEIIRGELKIFDCPLLRSVGKFASLKEIGGGLTLAALQLDSIVGFRRLRHVEFLNAESVSCFQLSAFDSLYSTATVLNLKLEGLILLEGFYQLDSVGTSLTISFGGSNISTEVFSRLRKVGSNISFVGWPEAVPNGFKNLKEVGFDIFVGSSGFENLDFLSGVNQFSFNEASIRISFCPNLIDISGLEAVSADSISRVLLINNPKLQVCHSDLFCAVLEKPEAVLSSIVISNAPGCASIEEVLEQCELKEDDEDPMADLCPMTSRPGMQIEKQSSTNYRILYSYGQERMLLEDVNYDRLTDLIVHFRMQKEVLFDFTTFDLKTLCTTADEIAKGRDYEYHESHVIGMEKYVDQVIAEASYLIYFTKLIDAGQCVKL